MQRLFLFCVCLCPGIRVAGAQHRLEPSAGYELIRYLDRSASAMPYIAHRATVGLDYAFSGKKGTWTAGFSGAYGLMYTQGQPGRTITFASQEWDGSWNSVDVPVKGNLYGWNIYAARLFRVNPAGPEANRAEFGPVFRWKMLYSSGFIPAGMMSAAGLGFRFEKHHAWQNHAIRFGAEIPLLAAVSRLPYHGSVSQPGTKGRAGAFFRSGTRMAALHTYQELNLQLAYYYSLRQNLQLGLEYAPAFSRYTLPREVRYLHHNCRFLVRITL